MNTIGEPSQENAKNADDQAKDLPRAVIGVSRVGIVPEAFQASSHAMTGRSVKKRGAKAPSQRAARSSGVSCDGVLIESRDSDSMSWLQRGQRGNSCEGFRSSLRCGHCRCHGLLLWVGAL